MRTICLEEGSRERRDLNPSRLALTADDTTNCATPRLSGHRLFVVARGWGGTQKKDCVARLPQVPPQTQPQAQPKLQPQPSNQTFRTGGRPGVLSSSWVRLGLGSGGLARTRHRPRCKFLLKLVTTQEQPTHNSGTAQDSPRNHHVTTQDQPRINPGTAQKQPRDNKSSKF